MTIMKVLKRNGRQEKFNDDKIVKCAERACVGLKHTDAKVVVMNATLKLYDGVTTKEIDEALIKSARSLIEQEPNYSNVAARILLNTIYKEVFDESADSDMMELQYRKAFIANIKKGVKGTIYDKELLSFDLKKLAEVIDISRDNLFEYIGLQSLNDRYLFKLDGKRIETPQACWMRIAMGLALGEKKEDRTSYAIKFYNEMSQFHYVPSTPTLFYAGSTRSQLSSCFLNTFEDSVFGIFDGLHQEAQKSKFAGGLGMDFTPFRAGGARIASTGGKTTGAVYTWKLFNDMLLSINQGGKRKGAGCGYLETWHYDIEDFLVLRKNVGEERRRCHDLNTANWIPDLFMKQIEVDGDWYLFSPEEVPDLHDLFGAAFEQRYWEYVAKGKAGEIRLFRTVKAKDLWKQMLKMLFETGHPWITFKDPCNQRYTNQHEGVVHSSNLCTEITLHTKATKFAPNNNREILEYGETAVCNLGSIVLSNHLTPHVQSDGTRIDWDKLGRTIKVAIRALDNVIDINFYPTEEAKKSNKRHRPVGLGSMGWHDVFIQHGIVYDSDEAVKMSGQIQEFMALHAIEASSQLAAEKGKYESYEGSLWSQGIFPQDSYNNMMSLRGSDARAIQSNADWALIRDRVSKQGMRNSNVMAIAPNASISSIVGCSPCTEPYFANIYVYSTISGDFQMINRHLVDALKKLKAWNRENIDALKASMVMYRLSQ
jgi:ribonucleoside-diphosphate reductase alpha chain